MTRPARDYFARRMLDPEYAAAYHILEEEAQAERARVSARLLGDSARHRPELFWRIFHLYPNLMELLRLLRSLPQQTSLRVGGEAAEANLVPQASGEASYDFSPVSTEATYDVQIQ